MDAQSIARKHHIPISCATPSVLALVASKVFGTSHFGTFFAHFGAALGHFELEKRLQGSPARVKAKIGGFGTGTNHVSLGAPNEPYINGVHTIDSSFACPSLPSGW